MKVFASVLTLTAIMATTVLGQQCRNCNDCPGDEVCFFAASPGTGGIGSCVEPNSAFCNGGEGFCDTATCD
ncbi:hypothetical protein THAR02_05239 [Trichoderma harzianum]|uniref:Uncharacterized protein n=1 Tax=Trichoderma harzianum TaxID=5544 RepID=A0A0F9XDG6_TRIHA|nr:hypothetical protein THAR02_05239 [Trichoderma harzianum]